MKKKNDKEGYDFWPEHYRYYGKSFKIRPQSFATIVLCNNCHESHACHYHNCILVYNNRGQIQTIYLFNVEPYKVIWIHHGQTIGTIYYKYPGLIYGNGKIINENFFFANVSQNQKLSKCIIRYCIFNLTQNNLINIHRDNKDQQILHKLAYGWTFFCVCKHSKQNKFYFYSTSKHILIPVQCSNPNILYYYILCEKNTPSSLLHLSLSSIAQHSQNHILHKKTNILLNTICKKAPKCHQYHLLPSGIRPYNIKCTGNGEYSTLISDW
jgi:hypothetical protein